MVLLKKLSLAVVGIAFCMGLFITSSDAQTRNGSWQNRNNSRQVQQRQNRQWQTRNNRNSRITPQEYRRLQRQRINIYQTRSRFYRNDGRISAQERSRLTRKYNKFQRNVRRDRRDY